MEEEAAVVVSVTAAVVADPMVEMEKKKEMISSDL